MNTAEKELRDIFDNGVRAVLPYGAVARHAGDIRTVYTEDRCKRLCMLAFGKAASGMAKAVLDGIGDIVTGGIVITKYGHADLHDGENVKVYEAGHPLPDENGMRATARAMEMADGLNEDDLLVCLVSGGGSALLVAPYPGVTLQEKQQTTDLLLHSGADINELNTVRKHLSRVKGGRLAEIAYPARIRSLLLSDVIGDRLDVIASGPTAPDRTTFADALGVLQKYRLVDRVPRSVRALLLDGANGRIPETPKAGDTVFDHVENTIIGSNRQALEAARLRAEAMGFATEVAAQALQGEAQEAARALARRAGMIGEGCKGTGKAVCMISGGETTVTVKGDGKGGRNTEFALAFALAIEGTTGTALLSAGTDGTDGPTDAAGAIVDGQTVVRARAAGIKPEAYLANNDSYSFFKKLDALLITGPTGTNVMDLQIVLITPPSVAAS